MVVTLLLWYSKYLPVVESYPSPSIDDVDPNLARQWSAKLKIGSLLLL